MTSSVSGEVFQTEVILFEFNCSITTLNHSTAHYNILFAFDRPASADQILIRTIPLSFTNEAMQLLASHWRLQLQAKQQALLAQDIPSTIVTQVGNALPSLMVNEKPVLWPGMAVTLRDLHRHNEQLVMTVSEIPYPFLAALKNEPFKSLAGISTDLRPPLAICTFGITTDQMLVLTVRGQTTNVYPGRLYGQGGNPTTVVFDLVKHQLDEMKDELLLHPSAVDVAGFRFYGLVEDGESFPGKPDLIGTVPLQISSADLLGKFEKRPPADRPPDVASLVFVPYVKRTLQYFLNEKGTAAFCPPAFGGLHLVCNTEWP